MVEPIVSVQSQLQGNALRDREVFAEAHVAGKESGAGEGVAAHDSAGKIRRRRELKGCIRVDRVGWTLDAEAGLCNASAPVGKIPLGEQGLQDDGGTRVSGTAKVLTCEACDRCSVINSEREARAVEKST